jgi:branched-chain amino acid transport system ATP-binding protein
MLAVENLSAGYDGQPVIHGVSLAIRPGEIVALIGANGAGKSTVARALSGLLPALGGAVRFQGAGITRWSPARRVRAGLVHVPEGRQVFAGLTVAQNLELGAYGAGDASTAAVVKRFPVLRERLHSVAGNLSGGQQQMLAIARGLMAGPRLLVLDEPSLGLSPTLVAEVFGLIAALRDQGIAILLSEQNARASLAIADRGYVIENGRVALSGAASELLASGEVAARYLGLGPSGEAGHGEAGRYARLTEIIRAQHEA